MLPRLMILAPLLFSATAFAAQPKADCANATTTPEINQCAQAEADVVEAKLNVAYQNLVKQLTQPDTETDKYSEMRKKLQIAQRAWIKFREADCDTILQINASGTIRTLAAIGCKRERAEQRIKELENYVGY
ncbi:MAG: lysozyme inhibitor LprI family protein [Pseudomonas sp.]|uniref:lysozyme inhibitor LprI family protein n=1 Tax=Pseudomonas abieticivorans TaxID=2931382 RepID=UPI0020BDD7B0|nr:lysozyme inhibitor LprI family protein [Pseudomonas sp. PIA16]MDE1166458.1 lysozyme inhibitor LprI family protein [Pseudomonas sp.]